MQHQQTMAGLLILYRDVSAVVASVTFAAAGGSTTRAAAEESSAINTVDNVLDGKQHPHHHQQQQQEQQQQFSSPSLFEWDYDEMHLSDFHNFSGQEWFNYSCQSLEISTNFLKDIIEPIICCSGIVGILLTMVVLTRKSMCTSCNCYLTALAVGDLIILLIITTRQLTDKLTDCNFHMSKERVAFLVYSIIVQDICLYLTVGVTVMLAVERYIAICHPMRAMGMCTVKRARTIIGALTLVATILRSPKFWDIDFIDAKNPTGGTSVTVVWTYPYNDAVYTYIVTVCMLTVLPLFILLVLNVRIIYEIRRSSRYLQYYLGADWRVQSVVSSEEIKITMMLIGVVLAFFVCHVPYMIYSLMAAFMEFDTVVYQTLTKSSALKYFKHVCHSLLALRSSCNFILYCWFSEKFWATFKRTFCIPYFITKQSSIRVHGFANASHHNRFHNHNNLHRSSYYMTRETTC